MHHFPAPFSPCLWGHLAELPHSTWSPRRTLTEKKKEKNQKERFYFFCNQELPVRESEVEWEIKQAFRAIGFLRTALHIIPVITLRPGRGQQRSKERNKHSLNFNLLLERQDPVRCLYHLTMSHEINMNKAHRPCRLYSPLIVSTLGSPLNN